MAQTDEETTRGRVFFALWPDPAVRARLAAIADALPETAGRKTRPANYHITLLFLGQLRRDMIEALREDAASVDAAPFTLSFDHLGWWPRPRVIWLAPSTPGEAIHHLVGQLNETARRRALPTDKRAFKPHITLMRKVTNPIPMPTIEPVEWPVTAFSLIESVTQTGGAEYHTLASWPLAW